MQPEPPHPTASGEVNVTPMEPRSPKVAKSRDDVAERGQDAPASSWWEHHRAVIHGLKCGCVRVTLDQSAMSKMLSVSGGGHAGCATKVFIIMI